MQIINRQLVVGSHRLKGAPRDESDEAPYLIAGPNMYVISRPSGRLGDIGAEHIKGEMGGIWAHPLKVAEGFVVEVSNEQAILFEPNEIVFEEHLSHVVWRWQNETIAFERRDAVVPSISPSICSQISLRNTSDTSQSGEIHIRVWLKFVPAWMSGLESGGGQYSLDNGWLLGRDRAYPDSWGVACGANKSLSSYRLLERDAGCEATLSYQWQLEAGEEYELLFALAAESQHGAEEAQRACSSLFEDDASLLERQASTMFPDGILIETPDHDLNRGIDLAQANLRLLEATYPDLGSYFLAGLPEYPQLFGCDTTYSVPGALAAGYVKTTRSALQQLGSYAARACGRVPHELITNGRVFHPGNIQETPQFVIACWDFVRWTGDFEFAEQIYPLCQEAIDIFLPMWCAGTEFYPAGDGMVERLGMGHFKLDSTAYHYAALQAMAELSAALGKDRAEHYLQRAAQLKERFNREWWYEDEQLFADSRQLDGSLRFDGHWTVVVPLQLGLSDRERSELMLKRIMEGGWVNEWGLVHTREVEPLVWTLPTGLLALAALQLGENDLGLKLLKSIAITTETGTLGTFKELIPEGLCFIQLWSAGLFLQGVVEGVLGIQPQAHKHALSVEPHLPADWDEVRIRGLLVGQHMLSLRIGANRLEIEHLDGPQPITVSFAGREAIVTVGQTVEL